ncbi:ATP-binding protein [Streptomyces griseofuscus]
MPAAVSSARPGGNAHTPLFALSGDTVLEPVTVVVAPDDDPQFMRMAFAAHQPRFRHITVHPTPLAGEAIHLAHDLIRSLGKHLPLPDQYSGRSRFANTTDSWHIAAAWSLIITSNRAPSDWYPLFPNPVVAESLLDRLINASHQVIMNGPSYRPNKRPKNPTDRTDKPPTG